MLKYLLALSFLSFNIYFLYFFQNQFHISAPYSSVVRDDQGKILSARVSNDGQWRISNDARINEKFQTALQAYEDRNFKKHFGISLKGIVRAIIQNIKKKKIFSGGSTITMQLMRLQNGNQNRSLKNKLLEILQSLKTELSYSKDSILHLYTYNAPFGSNVIGIEAASIKYFGHSSEDLSWAESATLSVLPNAPGLIFPGKNQQSLKLKRNYLLNQLSLQNKIDPVQLESAISEPLPHQIYSFPNDAYHLLDACLKNNYKNQRQFNTSIHRDYQLQIQQILQEQKHINYANGIYNAAVLVIDVAKNKVIAYQGNITEKNNPHENNVDIIQSLRSTGSLLKPYLYAHMLDAGELLPEQLIADIPTQIAGFTPQNYALTYDGAVPAKKALARSLNVPAVRLLKQYNLPKFLNQLQNLGFTSFNKHADHYGLSLILGGGESSLYELCSVYAHMAQKLLNKPTNKMASLYELHETKKMNIDQLSTGAIYQTFEAMLDVMRPDVDVYWKRFGKTRKIAWKTGTSFGYRDAWAIGLSADYVVGVWIGNATGEGRAQLTGIDKAAPVLFEVFNILPEKTKWFTSPKDAFENIEICIKSGHPASQYCTEKKIIQRVKTALHVLPCPYHKWIQTNEKKTFRVNNDCQTDNSIYSTWFVLPPAMEHYYIKNHADYTQLPPWNPQCQEQLLGNMELIYPEQGAKIYIPKEINNTNGQCVFELAHRNKNAQVFWYLDGAFLGKTNTKNQMAIFANKGHHTLIVTDGFGQSVQCSFEILNK